MTTLTREEQIKDVVIVEIIKRTQLQSAFLFEHLPNRTYIKMTLIRKLLKEGKLYHYRREEQKDRIWDYYVTDVSKKE